jgi:hypothetical protein
MTIRLPGRPAFGFGISLIVHAAVLAWLVRLAPPDPAHDAHAAPPARMQVTLLRLPPSHAEATPPPAAPLRRQSASADAHPNRRAAARPRPAAEPPPVIMPAPNEDSAAAPASAQGAVASFDLQTARGAARAWVKGEGAGRGGADGKGAALRATRDEQLGGAIERARRADCRGAYAGLGLLAVIPLAHDTLTGKGCKW